MLKQLSSLTTKLRIGRLLPCSVARRIAAKLIPTMKIYCRHFIEPPSELATELGRCEKVEGPISPYFGGGCLLGMIRENNQGIVGGTT
jgi:hypothetical protein